MSQRWIAQLFCMLAIVYNSREISLQRFLEQELAKKQQE